MIMMTRQNLVSCEDNDIQEVGPIVSDSEWSEMSSEVKWVVKWNE